MAPAIPMSPQKRVTRARAAAKKAGDDSKTSIAKSAPKSSSRKKSEADEEKSRENDMPAINEPLRKSARRVATSAPSRKIKITPLNGSKGSEQLSRQDDIHSEVPTKPRATRSRKTALDEAEMDGTKTGSTIAKPRGRPACGAKAEEAAQSAAPKLRGRPRKEVAVQDEATKQTRARTGSTATNTKALAVAPVKATLPKKKVTFQDLPECDKENQPLLQTRGTTRGKSTASASGIRAKPVRRPVATSRATARRTTSEATAEDTAQRILTPKKITQVAKSSSEADSDEDELSGAKTPIRDLSQSPKRSINIARMGSPVKKLDFGCESLASSPVKAQLTSTLSTPARRPVASPFKETLKTSPRRGDFFPKLPQGPNLNEVDKTRDPALSSMMFHQSPKRVALEPSLFPQSNSKASKSPSKASLLQSPPKRPISPVKASSTRKTKKPAFLGTQEANPDMMSPDVAVSSHFRVSQSPERPSRVRLLTADELVEEVGGAIDFDESIVDIRSPLKLGKKMDAVLEQDNEDLEGTAIIEGALQDDCLMNQVDTLSDSQSDELITYDPNTTTRFVEDGENRSTAPANFLIQQQTPINAASFLFRSSRFRDDDESSEDELQSPITIHQVQTPATAMGNKYHRTKTNQAEVEQNAGFTPLAAQLSGWLASSPDKKSIKRDLQRGIFSPVAAQHVPGEVVIDRQSPVVSRVSTEPRASMSRQSIASRRSFGQRSSLAFSISETPDKSTYFADEMAVKDLEEAVESIQAEDVDYDMLQETSGLSTVDNTLVEELLSEDAVEGFEMVQSQQEDISKELGEESIPDGVKSRDETSHEFLPEIDVGITAEEVDDKQQEPEISQESTTGSAYGDENMVPSPPPPAVSENSLVEPQQSSISSAVISPPSSRAPPNRFSTPLQPTQKLSRFANTVISKVPLRPEGDISPIKLPKKRSRSLSAGPSSVKKTPVLHVFGISQSSAVDASPPAQGKVNTPCSALTTPGQQTFAIDDFGDSTLDGIEIDEDDENLPPIIHTAASGKSFAATPCKTPKAQTPAGPSGVLQGAVVFVDVHTTEGADASGIFIELLTQMGAKCVKNWSWNSRASMGVKMEEAAATPGTGLAGAKIGITHVVYKDGGKRTLEKVRDTEGVVKCVGVGWVLE
jgi:hypothetical protein